MMFRFKLTMLAIPATALLLGHASAQTASPARQPMAAASGSAATSLSAADKKFINDAALGGMTEVTLGKLAQQNGASAEVKAHGQQMVDDHTKANEELEAIAKMKGVNPPTALDGEHQKAVDKVSGMNGAAFDKAFMAQMLTDHKKTVALFKKTASGAKDADIKGFAGKTLPTLEAHLKMFEDGRRHAGKTASAS